MSAAPARAARRAGVPAPRFGSPASTSLDELVGLRDVALGQARRARRRSGATRAGTAASARLGRGLDFAEVREYRPGDDVRLIDWNVTARTMRPHTKLFVEERERPVHLCVDFRAPMRFGTRGMYKSVLAARLAAVLGWRAVLAGDRTGGLVLADERHARARPAGGRRGLMALFRAIVQCQNLVPRAGGEGTEGALTGLARTVPSGASVWLLSDFADLDERAAARLGGAFAAHDLVLVHVIDPLDRALPSRGRLSVTGHRAEGAAPTRVEIRSDAQRRRHREAFEARRALLLEGIAARGRHPLVRRVHGRAVRGHVPRRVGARRAGPRSGRRRDGCRDGRRARRGRRRWVTTRRPGCSRG